MARQILTGPGLWFDAIDVAPELAAISLEATKQIPEETAFGSTYQERLVGLREWSMTGEALVDDADDLAGAIDDSVDGDDPGVWTFVPVSDRVIGQNAYMGAPHTASASRVAGSVGDVHRMSFAGTGDGHLPRGLTINTVTNYSVTTANSYTQQHNVWTPIGSGTVTPLIHAHILARNNTTAVDLRIQRASSSAGANAETLTTFSVSSSGALRAWRYTGSASTKRFFRLQYRVGQALTRVTAVVAVASI